MTYPQLYKWIDEEVEKYRVRFSKAETIALADAAELMLEFLEDFKFQMKIKETQNEYKSTDQRIQSPRS